MITTPAKTGPLMLFKIRVIYVLVSINNLKERLGREGSLACLEEFSTPRRVLSSTNFVNFLTWFAIMARP